MLTFGKNITEKATAEIVLPIHRIILYPSPYEWYKVIRGQLWGQVLLILAYLFIYHYHISLST